MNKNKTRRQVTLVIILLLAVASAIFITYIMGAKPAASQNAVLISEEIVQLKQQEVVKPISVAVANPAPKEEPIVETCKEIFVVTAYDLSVGSCGKPIGDPEYGITATGYNLSDHTWESARTVSVDPRVIPLGSKVKVTFLNSQYQKYNGVYTARDTGGAIKGNKIDFFIGDFKDNSDSEVAYDFGRQQAEVEIIEI